jgi:hypothetical protein
VICPVPPAQACDGEPQASQRRLEGEGAETERASAASKRRRAAPLTKWFEERGRHEIFAGNKAAPIGAPEHTLALRNEIVTIEEREEIGSFTG